MSKLKGSFVSVGASDGNIYGKISKNKRKLIIFCLVFDYKKKDLTW